MCFETKPNDDSARNEAVANTMKITRSRADPRLRAAQGGDDDEDRPRRARRLALRDRASPHRRRDGRARRGDRRAALERRERAGCKAVIDELLAPLSGRGRSARSQSDLRVKMDEEIKLNPFAKAAVEMALWDIAGKASKVRSTNCSAARSASRCRSRWSSAASTWQGAKLAEKFASEGTTHIKVKVGIDPAEDMQRSRRCATRRPGVWLSVDANCGWTLGDGEDDARLPGGVRHPAVRAADPARRPRALAERAARTAIPIMADESVFTLADAWLSPPPGGGHPERLPRQARRHRAGGRDRACREGGRPGLSHGQQPGTGRRHGGDAPRRRGLPGDRQREVPGRHLGPLYHEADLIRTAGAGPTSANVPDGPGLGVELDEERLG